jgi:hypothetical protein
MNEIEQTEKLLSKIDFALAAFRENDDFKSKITENEVLFRYASIEEMLLMARNDVCYMLRKWKKAAQE